MRFLLRLFLLITVVLIGCEGDPGPAGIDSLIVTTDEPVGANCAAGGLKVETGPDSNANGVLDADEIKSTKYVCSGVGGDEIRFQLLSLVALTSTSTTGTVSPEWMRLVKFNKSDFMAMHAAKLYAHISTEGSEEGSVTTVELFNVTDNVPITGSELSTSSATRVWLTSEDFLANIPDKEIDIAIRLRTNGDGRIAACIQAYLVLSTE